MRFNKLLILLLSFVVISGCGGGSGSGSSAVATSRTLVSLAVTPANPSLARGTVQQFSATGTYSDSTTQELTSSVNWTSSSASVAAIDATGRATAETAGTTTITATSGTISGSTALTVTSATLVSISIRSATSTIALGTAQPFSATGTFSDNTTQDISASVTWGSSASSVATISNLAGSNGKVTSLAPGITTITAVSGSISASASLTVTAATLSSVAVLPANPGTTLGTPMQFSATGTFSDGTTQNLTATGTWSSSSPAVATISNTSGSNGKATPVSAGTTTITLTVPITQPLQGSVLGSTILTVTGGSSGQVNVMPITVNGSLCSSATSGGYSNKPCVSVTVCTPGTSNCQVINDILLDTGSYGLRIFKQALSNVSLTQVTAGSGALAECVQYADGSSDWGPVQIATVTLGSEPAVQVPIQVIDSTFGTRSRGCRQADTSAANAGFTGVLGVGLFAQDCGDTCTSSSNNGNYYSCIGSVCSGTSVPLASQVTNPVALLPQDNNGVLVQLQGVPLGGTPSLNGSLILGIGTRTNNAPAGVTAFPANSAAEFTTTFNGVSSGSSFIDSGSNGLYFSAPASLLPDCGGSDTGYFCPAATVSLSATDTGALGSPSGTVPFYIGNFNSLITTSNNVFSEVGGSEVGGFDWGLPFFFGKNVYLGFDGTSSGLGSGPYWAY